MRALRYGFALVLAACGGEVPNALEGAATPFPPELGGAPSDPGWLDPTAPVPVPPPPAMDDPLLPMKPVLPVMPVMDDPLVPNLPVVPAMGDPLVPNLPAVPALGDPLRPNLPAVPALGDPLVATWPLPGTVEPLRPALTPPGGTPIWWRPPQMALEPMLNPKVWVSAGVARAGDEVRVSVANVPRGTRVVLAQGPEVPGAYRFCGSGFADGSGMVTGACRVAPGLGATATFYAYAYELGGVTLDAARINVINRAPDIDVGTELVSSGRFVPLAGDAPAHRDVLLRVHDPYGETFVATTVTADADGRWQYVLGLPINATLGRWTVFVHRKAAEEWLNAWFDVAPIAGAEVTPDLIGAYVLGLRPYDLLTFQFYDPHGWQVAELAGVANRHGWVVLNGAAPACARDGTWFVRMQYHDTRGDATWMDLTYHLARGWCLF